MSSETGMVEAEITQRRLGERKALDENTAKAGLQWYCNELYEVNDCDH